MPNVHDGHRQRMFEKFNKYGFSVFNDHEKLEIILYFSVPRRDTNELAHILLDRFKSISGVLDADEKELKKIPFITDRTIELFSIIKETSALYNFQKYEQKTYLNTTDEIATYFQLFFANERNEKVAIMGLNNKGKFMFCEYVSEGDINSVGLSTRKIVEKAISSSATVIVMCHNHPGGIALPSGADIYVTNEIANALKSIEVHLKDHIILSSDNDYVSMALSKEYQYIFK